jgi:N-acetylmuramoyl-L-alanine amidase
MEKNLNLPIAGKLAEILRRAGHEVLETRKTDIGLAPPGLPPERWSNADLAARVAVARGFKAELFVSVHCNASGTSDPKRTAHGIEVIHYDQAELAESVLRYMLAFTGATSRGIKSPPPTADPSDDPAKLEHWPVLHDPGCPSILPECGFLTHTAELARLMEPAYQVRLACGLAAGIMAHCGEVKT